MSPLAPVLQAYFTDRLIGQRAASPNTIGAYKVTFRLLLAYAATHTRKAPGTLDIADLDATLVAAFLDHLERDRHNSAATRNNRLAALHSLFGYLALQHPEHAATVPARARHPAQANPTQPGHLPHRARGRRAVGRLRPNHLDRPARPRHVRPRHPDRPADLGTRRPLS
jgi:site-specific recombinase XerD